MTAKFIKEELSQKFEEELNFIDLNAIDTFSEEQVR